MEIKNKSNRSGSNYTAEVVRETLGSNPIFTIVSGYGENVSKFVDGRPTKEIEATRYVFGIDDDKPITVKFPANYAPDKVNQYDKVEILGLVGIRITRGNKVYYKADSIKKVKD